MRILALGLLAVFSATLVPPAAARTPLPPPPEPAQLEAARSFVESLPLAEVAMRRFPAPTSLRSELVQALVERAALLDPESRRDGIADRVRDRIGARIDRDLPAILPAASEEMAVAFAWQFRIPELKSAATFFGSADGRAMAGRFVLTDPVVSSSLRLPLYRSIEPELELVIAEAKAAERLRRRINEAR